jgi:hypothetical protein
MKVSKNSHDIEGMLTAVYEEVMWLANRPNTSPAAARAWYTHIASNRLRRYLRIFSGKVSRRALEPDAVLRLDHFKRLQATLTKLVAKHLRKGINPSEFIKTVTKCERVHIVTFQENYRAMTAGGDYVRADISLIDWESIPQERQRTLWTKVLNGKVSNASEFEPMTDI